MRIEYRGWHVAGMHQGCLWLDKKPWPEVSGEYAGTAEESLCRGGGACRVPVRPKQVSNPSAGYGGEVCRPPGHRGSCAPLTNVKPLSRLSSRWCDRPFWL